MLSTNNSVKQPDFQKLFQALPGLYLILLPDENFTIVCASDAYLKATLTKKEDIIGKALFAVFPEDSTNSNANGKQNLLLSLNRVITERVTDTMAVLKYDILRPSTEGSKYESRYWTPINTPVLDDEGNVEYIINRVEDVTDFIMLKQAASKEKKASVSTNTNLNMEADIYNRAQEIQRAQNELVISNQRYKALTSILPVGVFNIDAEDRCLFVNPAWEGMVGLKLQQMNSLPWYELIHPEDKERIRKEWLKVKGKENYKTEFRLLGLNGEEKWVLAQIMPETNGKEVTGFTGSITDITELKYQEEIEAKRANELTELDKAKTVFFSNISHEFRTPLTLMLGPLQDSLADNTFSQDAIHKERQLMIYKNAQRLLKLVNSLLDFSRVEAKRMQAIFEPTDLSQITSDLASMFRSVVDKAGLSMIVDTYSFEEPIYLDKEMYEKIIFNLLSNAFKYTFKGTIRITLTKQNDHAVISVQDTGIGIPPNELSHVFDRFYRVEGAQGRSYEGSGIGLALIQELIKLHGGSIRVESTVNKGSTFIVSIPLGKAHLPIQQIGKRATDKTGVSGSPYLEEAYRWLPVIPQLSESFKLDRSHSEPKGISAKSMPTVEATSPVFVPSISTHKSKILIVDDNMDMCRYISSLLSPFWNVMISHDGEAALQIINSQHFNLVISDVMMPNVNGFELIKLIRSNENTKLIPIMLLSARAGEEAHIEGLQAGADDYLTKPFAAKELLARVNTQLELGNLRKHLEDQVALRTQELSAANIKLESGVNERLKLQADLTAQSVRSEEAEKYQRKIKEFYDTLCHEIRNPLNGMHGGSFILKATLSKLAELLENDREDVKKLLQQLESDLEIIQVCAEQQKIIVNDVLTLSKIESNKMQLNIVPFDLKIILNKIAKMYQHQISQKKLDFFINMPEMTDAWFKADSQHLTQILINLISNALKFTQKGSITISTNYEPLSGNKGTLHFSVTDTGMGMIEKEQALLFSRFSQASSQIAAEYGGSGLGLSIAKQLVDLMGGTIHVTSVQGQGTQFTFTIPCERLTTAEKSLIEKDRPKARKSSISSNLLAGKLVLIAEDSTPNQKLLCHLLELHACQWQLAKDGEEAITAFETASANRFDLILMDLQMPGVDGFSAIKAIRQLELKSGSLYQTPIIALSGNDSEEIREQAAKAGINDYLTKPYDQKTLIDKIFYYINQASKRAIQHIPIPGQVIEKQALSNAPSTLLAIDPHLSKEPHFQPTTSFPDPSYQRKVSDAQEKLWAIAWKSPEEAAIIPDPKPILFQHVTQTSDIPNSNNSQIYKKPAALKSCCTIL